MSSFSRSLSAAFRIALPARSFARAAGAKLLCILLLAGVSHAQTTPHLETAYLRASNAGETDNFGTSVSIDGDRAVIGAIGESGASDLANRAGAAYVFERGADGTWTEVALLRASAPSSRDEFGYSVALEGDRILVGARQEDGPDDQTGAAGAAYVFERSADGTWTEVAILRASNMGPADEFGRSVSLDGDQALIGAWQEEGPDDEINGAGAAYIFERSADGTWTETALLRASDAESGDQFGHAVAMDGGRAIVGAASEDGASNQMSNAGVAYLYGPSSLPVELTALRGIALGDAVQLTWETASETNNAGFTVQRRRADGEWRRVGFVEGHGTTSDPQTYRFRDADLPFAEVLVYRLKQIDTDGTAVLSPEVVVRRSAGAEVDLAVPFPHPVRRQATVQYVVPDGSVQPVRLDVFNVLGQRVATLVDGGQASGRKELTLDTDGWTSGVYLLRLQVGGATKSQRMTVVR